MIVVTGSVRPGIGSSGSVRPDRFVQIVSSRSVRLDCFVPESSGLFRLDCFVRIVSSAIFSQHFQVFAIFSQDFTIFSQRFARLSQHFCKNFRGSSQDFHKSFVRCRLSQDFHETCARFSQHLNNILSSARRRRGFRDTSARLW